MNFFYSLLTLFLLISSCKKSDPALTASNEPSITGMDIAVKLKEWSLTQPQPFVICGRGDTIDGKLYTTIDFITNIFYDSMLIQGEIRNSVRIDTSAARSTDFGLTNVQRKLLLDSISLPLSEQQMSSLLFPLGLKLRMMQYDSLTYNLNLKLLKWGGHQFPPKIIWTGFYSFVAEGPNAGGYSRVWFTYQGVQNLQYFTRKISQPTLSNIVALVDTSLTYEQLHNIMLPIAPIQVHDTWFGRE